MLTLTTKNSSDLDFSKTSIGLNIQGGIKLNNGDTINLIYAQHANINKNPSNTGENGTLLAGTQAYDYTILQKDGDTIYAKIGSASKDALEMAKNVIETAIGEVGLLSSSADLLSGINLNTANSDGSFGAVKGSKTRYKSGSHVDVDALSAVVGLTKDINGNDLGAFIEVGGGDF